MTDSPSLSTVGVPREVKNSEHRVAMTPDGVRELGRGGVRVLVETGAGLVQGMIERVEVVLKPADGEGLGHTARVSIAMVTLCVGGLMGSLGIVELIARGYSALSVGFAVVYIIPVCTLGVIKIARFSSNEPSTKENLL